MKLLINHISAEFLKIKSTPIYYIVAGCGFLIAVFLFIGNTADVHGLSKIGINPWGSYLRRGMVIFSIFMVIPLVVLLVSSMLYTEQKSNAFKLLYTLPTNRGFIYFSKLATILLLTIFTCIVLYVILIVSGYILGAFYPEFEFAYHTPRYGVLLEIITHTFIAILGIIGIQYLLSIYSKHILVPIGVGFLGLIVGFILYVGNNAMSLYFPYTYPMVAQNLGVMPFDYRTKVLGDWLTNIELYSILVFIASITIGYFYETRRSVK